MPSLYDGKNQKWSPLLRGFGAMINIGFNFWLIPIYGVVGSAFSTLIAYGIMFLSLYQLNRLWLPIKLERNSLIIVVSMCIFNYLYIIYFSNETLISFLMTIFILFNVLKIAKSIVKNSFS